MEFLIRQVKNGFELTIYSENPLDREADVYVFSKASQVIKAVKEVLATEKEQA